MSNALPKVCLFVILAVVTLPVAFAATHVASANVPFAFTVNGVTLNAGEYYFEVSTGGSVLTLRDAAGHRIMCMTTAGADTVPDQSRAVFVKSGNTYKLSEVSMAGPEHALVIPRASRNNDAARVEISLLRR